MFQMLAWLLPIIVNVALVVGATIMGFFPQALGRFERSPYRWGVVTFIILLGVLSTISEIKRHADQVDLEGRMEQEHAALERQNAAMEHQLDTLVIKVSQTTSVALHRVVATPRPQPTPQSEPPTRPLSIVRAEMGSQADPNSDHIVIFLNVYVTAHADGEMSYYAGLASALNTSDTKIQGLNGGRIVEAAYAAEAKNRATTSPLTAGESAWFTVRGLGLTVSQLSDFQRGKYLAYFAGVIDFKTNNGKSTTPFCFMNAGKPNVILVCPSQSGRGGGLNAATD